MAARTAIFLALAPLLAGCVTCPPGSWTQLPCCAGGGDQQTVSISTGTAPWRVMAPTSTVFQAAVAATPDPAWTALAPGQWVTLPGAPVDAGDYVYEMPFNVAPCPGEGTVQVTGELAADNGARVYIDGGAVPIAVSLGTQDYGFLPSAITPFAASVPYTASGTHTLKVVVTNREDVTGLIVRGQITRVCSTAILSDPTRQD